MSALHLLRAELAKAVTLPAVWIGVAVTVLGCAAVTVLNAVQTAAAIRAGTPDRYGPPSVVDTAFAASPLGAVGAIVVGVALVSSEYAVNTPDAGGGRQIGTSLVVTPRRLGMVAAKTVVVGAVIAAMALVVFPVCVGIARLALGSSAADATDLGTMLARGAGGGLYWLLMALLATGVTLLARSGVIPLIVLIVNSSVVSVSLLLTNLTPLAHWLPDMAGRNLFGFDAESVVPGGLDPVPGALVMASWSVLALTAGAVAFCRRDA